VQLVEQVLDQIAVDADQASIRSAGALDQAEDGQEGGRVVPVAQPLSLGGSAGVR